MSALEIGVAFALFGAMLWALLSARGVHIPVLEIGGALGLLSALIWAVLAALYVAALGLTAEDLTHEPEYWIAFPGAHLESETSYGPSIPLVGGGSSAILHRTFRTTASRSDVLAFYRQELASRGWSVFPTQEDVHVDRFDACARSLHLYAAAGSGGFSIDLSSLIPPGRTFETPECRKGTPPPPEAVALVAVAVFVAYISTASAIQRRARRVRGRPLRAAGGVARWGPALSFVPYLMLDGRPGPTIAPGDPVVSVGLALIVLGAGFALWAAMTLGTQFDLEPEVHEGHTLVRRGPFRFVRHPVYLGLAVHLVGACIGSGNLALAIGVLFVGLPLLYLRARAEEQLLRAELGSAYDAYAREVGMFLPRLTRGAG